MRYPISVCMIVKNEASNLQKSIPSVLPFVEEVIVVDTGSTDDSQSVATSLGAIVHDFTWQDDFSAARNVSLSLATRPFIWVIDADEVFAAETEPALQRYLDSHQGRAGTVWIKNVTESESDSQTLKLPRIFPNRLEFRYERRIHEQLRKSGNTPHLVTTDLLLLHHGYLAESIIRQNKMERNLRLLELEHKTAPDDPYILYQLAKTLYMDKQYSSAAKYFQTTIDVLSTLDGSPAFLPSLLLQYGYTLLHQKEFSALFQVLETGTDLFPDYTHLYFLYGQALIELKDPTRLQEIRDVFEFCLQKGDDHRDSYESVPGVGSFMAQFNLGVYYEVTGQLGRAKELYRQSAEAGYPPAKQRLSLLETNNTSF